ncbi:nitrate- and nitrite sensing domain-containing protein [Streptomyces sodiiphilus]|uniref:histidine kinase n=1 Tax=Streptomyces sodiiphilus TaxID=226217 RepID=A0ABP5BB41_9ACTN
MRGEDLGEGMRFRGRSGGRSIRRKILALLSVPLLSLVSIWAFATAITAQEARQLLAVSAVFDTLGAPAQEAVHAVQEERRQTLVYLADPRRSDALSELHRSRESTDGAVAVVRSRAGAAQDLGSGARDRLDALLAGLDRLDQIRDQVGSNTVSRSGALGSYNAVVEPGLGLVSALHLLEDVELDRHGRAVAGLGQAREFLSQEDALVAGALAAGRATDKELRALTDRMAERRLAYRMHLPDLPLEERQSFESFWQHGAGRVLTTVEESLLENGTATVRQDQWETATAAALDGLRALEADAGERYHERVGPEAGAVLTRAAAAGVVGFLAVLVSVVVSVRIGRGLVRDLRELRKEATEAAQVRLPTVLRRLADGERVDVETEAPRLEYGQDEVGQVGQALNTLQRAAVQAAVKQSDTRRGVSDVFVNLARRNQVLLHRQLSLLETMERRTGNPDELAEFYRLDHLTTRMRRHAEGLVILSGAAPARQLRGPVLLMDVIRSAVSQIEDYERVEVRGMPSLAVTGSAVADLTHLVAELLENATVFSPPHTAVQVTGERVAQGFALEIHDRGLGMTPEAMAEANQRLEETPEFDLSDTDRLGLFVVSRLARRLEVRVGLQKSPYGGTTAVVFLPGELLTEAADASEGTGRPAVGARHTLVDGPMDGPVELDVSVPLSVPGPGKAAHPPEASGDDLIEHAGPGEPSPLTSLPRQRRVPVLVADHGRTVGHLPPGEHRGGGESGPAQPTTAAGLPRRVRRGGPGAGPARPESARPDTGNAAAPDTGDEERGEMDPEEIRSRMAALQSGWRRGREHTDARPGNPAGDDSAKGQQP